MDVEDWFGVALIERLFSDEYSSIGNTLFGNEEVLPLFSTDAKAREGSYRKNRKQAIGRFLAGRKLGEKTRSKFDLSAEFLESLRGWVDPGKKWKYDRVAYVRRREKNGKIPSLKLQKAYRLDLGEKVPRAEKADGAPVAPSSPVFRKKRSPRRTRARACETCFFLHS